MAARDGSFSFDFEGVYTEVRKHRRIAFTMSDGRKVNVDFTSEGDATKVVETFEPESTHSIEMQREGWQAILESLKGYTEAQ
jgi:uncharacterized protein YndB with AHSA1/START domain